MAGAAVTWTAPTATDIVDAAPSVACLPASGSTFAVGSTTVTCTATDASGNTATGSFAVRVTYVPPVTASAVWHEPLSSDGGTFSANRGRTVPVKVSLAVDGVTRTSGSASLRLVPVRRRRRHCRAPGHGLRRRSLERVPGHLQPDRLRCYTVTASIDGHGRRLVPAGAARRRDAQGQGRRPTALTRRVALASGG